jgi:hypothetical protein
LQVLVQRLAGDESHFAAYVRNLPRGVPGIPLFFSGAAIEAIDYPPIVEQVRGLCQPVNHQLINQSIKQNARPAMCQAKTPRPKTEGSCSQSHMTDDDGGLAHA